MKNIKISSNIIPTRENPILLTKNGTPLQEIMNYIDENLSHKFESIELFYDCHRDKIQIVSITKNSNELFSEFIENIEKSKYVNLFDFES